MRKALLLAAVVAAAVAVAIACGEAAEKPPTVPESAFDLNGPDGGASCQFFPDTCAADKQCYNNANEPGATVCGNPGGRQLAQDCDNESGDRAQYCARQMACITYGAPPDAVKLCTPLCNNDADCNAFADGGTITCTAIAETTISVCPLPR